MCGRDKIRSFVGIISILLFSVNLALPALDLATAQAAETGTDRCADRLLGAAPPVGWGTRTYRLMGQGEMEIHDLATGKTWTESLWKYDENDELAIVRGTTPRRLPLQFRKDAYRVKGDLVIGLLDMDGMDGEVLVFYSMSRQQIVRDIQLPNGKVAKNGLSVDGATAFDETMDLGEYQRALKSLQQQKDMQGEPVPRSFDRYNLFKVTLIDEKGGLYVVDRAAGWVKLATEGVLSAHIYGTLVVYSTRKDGVLIKNLVTDVTTRLSNLPATTLHIANDGTTGLKIFAGSGRTLRIYDLATGNSIDAPLAGEIRHLTSANGKVIVTTKANTEAPGVEAPFSMGVFNVLFRGL